MVSDLHGHRNIAPHEASDSRLCSYSKLCCKAHPMKHCTSDIQYSSGSYSWIGPSGSVELVQINIQCIGNLKSALKLLSSSHQTLGLQDSITRRYCS